ncbi:hypothetical protein EJ04DRAFT_560833 [Polyplosphaeria fusca]|uniref:Uncharacterized protein n=1 Tax=Polyplosphaeria fusca TaxID=682080 RepID=A0A9P4R518_9PLEO|nr:hypothetical protein EJ04DRAFT_560833 [Polyplosphaeria fusca]
MSSQFKAPNEPQDEVLVNSSSKPTHHQPSQISRLVLLPGELKDMIIEAISSQQDLSSLSKTCIDIRNATIPFLFQHITINPGSPQGYCLTRVLEEDRTKERFANQVTVLTLTVPSIVSRIELLNLLSQTPKLTKLACTYCLNQVQETFPTDVDGEELSWALKKVKDTLKYLKIEYIVSLRSDHGRPTAWHPCVLKQFPVLMHLEIPFFVLLGWPAPHWSSHGSRNFNVPTLSELLPRSLVSLKFGDDDWMSQEVERDSESMLRKFEEFFAGMKWKEATPNLKRVVLSLQGFDDAYDDDRAPGWRQPGEDSFKRLCVDNGLECEVLRDHWAQEGRKCSMRDVRLHELQENYSRPFIRRYMTH